MGLGIHVPDFISGQRRLITYPSKNEREKIIEI